MSQHRVVRRLLAGVLLVAVGLPLWFLSPAQTSVAQAAPSTDRGEEIVYLDNEGVIRVLDTEGSPLVRWFSPVGGFADIDLADVNNDGEYEIIGVRQVGATGILYVFDPVIASGTIKPDQKIPPETGIPWDTLYTRQIPGKPTIVEGGNFDLNVPGDEILYGYQRDDGKFIITVLKGTSQTPDGRSWTEHIPAKEFDNPFDQVDSGDINGKGAEDVVLVDSESETTRVGYYEIDNNMARIDSVSSRNSPWNSARLGQVRGGGAEEIILTRSSAELASLLIFRYNPDDGSVEEQSNSDLFVFVPNPIFGFPADLTGNGDDEVFIIRRHPEANGARLIMRNEWGDDRNNTISVELPLDADNGYRVGAGGDLDDDGKDEVVIMRDNNIRVYTRLDSTVNDFANYGLATNRRNLVIGDLDRLGFVQGPQFGVNPSRVEAAIPAGTQSAAYPVQITNISTGEPIAFNIRTPLPSWVSVTPLFGQTTAIMGIAFNAATLQPGRYEATLLIDSTNPAVTNKPFPLPVVLTVTPPELILNPTGAIFLYDLPIDPQADNLRTAVFEVGGTAGLKYTAAVLEVPAGVSAQQLAASVSAARTPAGDLVVSDAQGRSTVLPSQGLVAAAADDTWPIAVSWVISAHSSSTISGVATVPDILEVTVDGGAIAGDALITEAVVVLVPDARAGSASTSVRVLPIAVIRTDQRIYVPMIQNFP